MELKTSEKQNRSHRSSSISTYISKVAQQSTTLIVPENTPVLTTKGWKNAKSVDIGDKILRCNLLEQEVTALRCNFLTLNLSIYAIGEATFDCVLVKYNNSLVESLIPKDHYMMVLDGAKIFAKDLKGGENRVFFGDDYLFCESVSSVEERNNEVCRIFKFVGEFGSEWCWLSGSTNYYEPLWYI